ncbi:MAG: N-acetylglucosamine-6-phosphate deacetylase [Oscillospiraceae bacterium]|nr:N-acetylglucosamine-6-phosphate deacetylase [Oscillospiraceae bacterium]
MITKISNGIILADGREQKTNLYIEDDKILALTDENLPFDREIDAKGLYVSAGFVDMHLHGAAGHEFLDGTVEAYQGISAAVAQHGTTAIAPTLAASSLESMKLAIEKFEEALAAGVPGAKLLGIHLEGPYFAMSQKGAQDPRHIRDFDPAEYEQIVAMTDHLLSWTAAPERKGAEAFGKFMRQHGILACIGHSDANCKTAHKAFENGFTHVTHLYSCTSTVHRINAFRHAGIIEEAYLNDDMTVEIIADGCHLPDDLLRLVYKLKGPDKVALVTDSMRAAGMPEGATVDGLLIEDGVAKLPDRSAFAGSIAYGDRLVRNMVNMAGVPVALAVKMASENPAKFLRVENVGRLAPGYFADVTLFDEGINIKMTMVNGKEVYSVQ